MGRKKEMKKGFQHKHKRKLRLRLGAFVLFVAGMLAMFAKFGQGDLFLASSFSIAGILGGFVVCAYIHDGAKIAAALGVAMLELPLLLENVQYWYLFALLGAAALHYIAKHD